MESEKDPSNGIQSYTGRDDMLDLRLMIWVREEEHGHCTFRQSFLSLKQKTWGKKIIHYLKLYNLTLFCT